MVHLGCPLNVTASAHRYEAAGKQHGGIVRLGCALNAAASAHRYEAAGKQQGSIVRLGYTLNAAASAHRYEAAGKRQGGIVRLGAHSTQPPALAGTKRLAGERVGVVLPVDNGAPGMKLPLKVSGWDPQVCEPYARRCRCVLLRQRAVVKVGMGKVGRLGLG
jgi:hypothetical protein